MSWSGPPSARYPVSLVERQCRLRAADVPQLQFGARHRTEHDNWPCPSLGFAQYLPDRQLPVPASGGRTQSSPGFAPPRHTHAASSARARRRHPLLPCSRASASIHCRPSAPVAMIHQNHHSAPASRSPPASPRLSTDQPSAARRLSCSRPAAQPGAVSARSARRCRLLGQRQEVGGMAPRPASRPRRSPPAAPARTRGSSPASRSAARRPAPPSGCSRLLSTSEATPSSTSSPRVAVGVDDRLGRLQRAAADEDRQAPEERLLVGPSRS